MPTDRELIAEWHRLVTAATPAPWYAADNDIVGGRCIRTVDEPPSTCVGNTLADEVLRDDDADLIAWMRNHLPEILCRWQASERYLQQRIAELEAAVDRVNDLSIPAFGEDYAHTDCAEAACAACWAEDIRRAIGKVAPRQPALGYIVLSCNPDSGRLQPQGRVHDSWRLADQWRVHLESPGGPRIPPRPGTSYFIATLRKARTPKEAA